MAESVVVVQRNGGGYVQGGRVTLGFSNGVTDSVYTDSDGEAVIEHRTTGTATVYVNGQDKGSMNAPAESSSLFDGLFEYAFSVISGVLRIELYRSGYTLVGSTAFMFA